MPNYSDRFGAEYAVRTALCRGCNVDITKGELRIRFCTPTLLKNIHFYHPKCIFNYFTKRMRIKITSTADVNGFSSLSHSDQRLMTTLIDNFVLENQKEVQHESKIAAVKNKKANSAKQETKTGKESNKKSKKRKLSESEEDEEVVPKKVVKKQDSTKKKISKKSSTSKKVLKKQSSATSKTSAKKVVQPKAATPKLKKITTTSNTADAKTKATKKTTKAKTTEKKASKPKAKAHAPVVVPAPAPVVAAPAPAKAAPAATKSTGDKKKLSDEAKKAFANIHVNVSVRKQKLTMDDLTEFTVNDLKLALKYNDRSSTGNKTDLSKAIIDCITNGCPPRCPKCGGGRLKVKKSGKNNEFYCPGYMEDDDFINCGFKSDSVARIPWKNPQ